MAQFGAGQELSAQCLRLPPPEGWRVWTDADGPMPEALAQRAAAAITGSGAIGSTEIFPLPGTQALIRVESHLWGRDTGGELTQGCFRAANVYLPLEQSKTTVATVSSSEKLTKTVNILTVVSIVVGTVATIAAWGRGK